MIEALKTFWPSESCTSSCKKNVVFFSIFLKESLIQFFSPFTLKSDVPIILKRCSTDKDALDPGPVPINPSEGLDVEVLHLCNTLFGAERRK